MPTIEGHNDPSRDFRNIQEAVMAATEPVTLDGKFNFGGGWDGWRGGPLPRKTVVISRPVRIQAGRGGAEILGGGEKLASPWGAAPSGPFKVMNTREDAGPVVFEGIHFEGWKGEAILVETCRGLEVRNCRFTMPAPGTLEGFIGQDGRLLNWVHAILAIGSGCKGRFLAQGNKCDMRDCPTDPLYVVHPHKPAGGNEPVPPPPTPHPEPPADDQQFLACVNTSFSEIKITGNHIWGYDAGLEVIANDRTAQQRLEIVANKIWLEQTVGERWPGHFGILCCDSKDAVISGNIVEHLKGPGAAFLLSGENFTVTENLVQSMEPLNAGDRINCPVAGFLLGANSPMPDFFPVHSTGPSIVGSVISNNTLHGVAKFGIKTFDYYYDVFPLQPSPLPNDSNNNTMENNNLRAFTPVYASLFLGSGTHDNTCSGWFPGPEGRPGVIDEGVNNHVTALPSPPLPHRPPLARAPASGR